MEISSSGYEKRKVLPILENLRDKLKYDKDLLKSEIQNC